ncbi:MAG: nuclear transport factor 2 family protein [Acidimicrobiia bacterium]
MSGDLRDRAEIQELTGRYALCVDTQDVEGMVGLWTDDGAFDASATGLPRIEGIDAIRRFFESTGPNARSRCHLMANLVLDEIDGDRARGTCYFSSELVTLSGARLATKGYYEDDYARVDGRWRLRHRKVVPLIAPSPEDLATALGQ